MYVSCVKCGQKTVIKQETRTLHIGGNRDNKIKAHGYTCNKCKRFIVIEVTNKSIGLKRGRIKRLYANEQRSKQVNKRAQMQANRLQLEKEMAEEKLALKNMVLNYWY